MKKIILVILFLLLSYNTGHAEPLFEVRFSPTTHALVAKQDIYIKNLRTDEYDLVLSYDINKDFKADRTDIHGFSALLSTMRLENKSFGVITIRFSGRKYYANKKNMDFRRI